MFLLLGLIRIDVSSTVAYATRGEGIGSVPWLLGVAEPYVAAGGGQRCVECGSGPPSSAEGAALLVAPRCPSHGNRPRPPVGKRRRGGCCCSAVHRSSRDPMVGTLSRCCRGTPGRTVVPERTPTSASARRAISALFWGRGPDRIAPNRPRDHPVAAPLRCHDGVARSSAIGP